MKKVASKTKLDRLTGEKSAQENPEAKNKKVQVQAPAADQKKVEKAKAEDSEKRADRGRREPKTVRQTSSKTRELLKEREGSQGGANEASVLSQTAKARPKSPTKPKTPPILQRQRSKERKVEEEKQAQAEKEKALNLIHSRALDWERLQALCQPKKAAKKEDEEVPPAKPARVFTDEELTRQRKAVARLYQVKKQIEDPEQKAIKERNKVVVKKLR